MAANASLVTAGCWNRDARGIYPPCGTWRSRHTSSRDSTKSGTRTSTDFPPVSARPASQSITFSFSLFKARDSAVPDPNLGPVLAVPHAWVRWSRWTEERGGDGGDLLAANLQAILRCLGSRLAQRVSQSTTAIPRDPTLLCAGAKLSIRVCGLEGRRSTGRGWQSMPTSAAGTDTAACHQPTDRETGALISAASLLALTTTTTQSAVACEVELSQCVSSFRIDAFLFPIQVPLRQRSAMGLSLSGTRPARERMSKD